MALFGAGWDDSETEQKKYTHIINHNGNMYEFEAPWEWKDIMRQWKKHNKKNAPLTLFVYLYEAYCLNKYEPQLPVIHEI